MRPLQGSACIYSKKVEFLYSLVFHTLDLVTAKKRSAAAKKSSIGANGDDADFLAQEEEFLELDDVLQEANNIDLVEYADEDADTRRRRRIEAPRERLGGLRLEQALGEESYRITSSTVAKNGTLLLDVGTPGLLSLSPIRHENSPHGGRFGAGVATPGIVRTALSPGALSYGGAGGDDGDSPIDYGAGGDGGYDDAATSAHAGPTAAGKGRTKPGVGVRRALQGMTGAVLNARPAVNPWATLDPYAVDESSARPFMKRELIGLGRVTCCFRLCLQFGACALWDVLATRQGIQ